MAGYVAVANIKHDGKTVEAGSKVAKSDFTDDQWRELLAAGSVAESGTDAAKDAEEAVKAAAEAEKAAEAAAEAERKQAEEDAKAQAKADAEAAKAAEGGGS